MAFTNSPVRATTAPVAVDDTRHAWPLALAAITPRFETRSPATSCSNGRVNDTPHVRSDAVPVPLAVPTSSTGQPGVASALSVLAVSVVTAAQVTGSAR